MKPKPRERSDCKHVFIIEAEVQRPMMTHPLVVDDGDLFHMSVTTKFIFKVAFLGANAQPKDTEHIGRIWLLLGLVSFSTQN